MRDQGEKKGQTEMSVCPFNEAIMLLLLILSQLRSR
jgi:hypothetical protein